MAIVKTILTGPYVMHSIQKDSFESTFITERVVLKKLRSIYFYDPLS